MLGQDFMSNFLGSFFAQALWALVGLVAGGFLSVWTPALLVRPLSRIWKFAQRGTNISGDWGGSYTEDEHVYSETIEVWQVGSRIWGKSTETATDEDFPAKYRFRGTIQDGIISAVYRSEASGSFEQGKFVLSLAPNVRAAEGRYLHFREPGRSTEVSAVEYRWTR